MGVNGTLRCVGCCDAPQPMDEPTAPLSPDPPPPAEQPRLQPVPDHAEQALADVVDDAVPSRSYEMMPMVGLGGSAGSIAALQAFFAATPADSGMAFVVVMHLSAEHESSLAQIIQRTTSMPVQQVNETVRTDADHVYVIPPGKTLSSANGYLTVADLSPERGRRVAVDLFFRTLADTHGPNALAIVLSGADGDGAIGIKRVKERGGLTIAQDPSEAEHSGMPRSAIATGMVDWVLPVADMPSRLASYTRVLARLRLPPEVGPQPAQPLALPPDQLETALRNVLDLSARQHRARLQLLQAGDDPAPHRPAHERQRHRRAGRLRRFPAHPPGRGRRAAQGPADQRHQLLSRSRRLRRARD